MYGTEFYDPHYYRDLRDMHPIYDLESHHAMWHPAEIIRERELDLSLASHQLENLELYNLQLERERAMALNDLGRVPHVSSLHPGHEILEPYSMGYGHGVHGVYPSYETIPPPHYDPPIIPLREPLYHSTPFQPPPSVPMMDPYFINTVMPSLGSTQFTASPMRDPFSYGIDHDYGYGPIKPLSSYGLAPGVLQHGYGRSLDDLYLFEMMLRLDQTLEEHERILRWQDRLAWEALSQAERHMRWQQMDLMQRCRLGLGAGSYWGHEIGGFPIDQTFGYWDPALGLEVIQAYRPLGEAAPIMGICGQSHLPISPALSSYYPMWNVGGLGLGARISSWLGELSYITPKQAIRRENMLRDYAERRGEIPPRF